MSVISFLTDNIQRSGSTNGLHEGGFGDCLIQSIMRAGFRDHG